MVKWKGIKKAKRNFSKMKNNADDDLNDSLNKFSQHLESTTKENAVFVKGYSTGHLKRSIYSGQSDGIGAFVKSPAYYSGYVENGTRYMDAQPFFFSTIMKEVESSLSAYILKR